MAKLPDDPPVQFRWRGKSRRVRLAEGPERIGQEWWRKAFDEVGPGKVRDYYRVEDEAGERFWIFRAGLYGDGEKPRSGGCMVCSADPPPALWATSPKGGGSKPKMLPLWGSCRVATEGVFPP
jgi:hypothetical protein